ncbi:hypothetical protein V6N12_058307 [Hibiscus sabdariffa]|uniref:Uncharacterized protein n=1 Tax=Hibiscus sabdariffa TaxID=183260 RepID=A0ABR2ETQ0_9ROSI
MDDTDQNPITVDSSSENIDTLSANHQTPLPATTTTNTKVPKSLAKLPSTSCAKNKNIFEARAPKPRASVTIRKPLGITLHAPLSTTKRTATTARKPAIAALAHTSANLDRSNHSAISIAEDANPCSPKTHMQARSSSREPIDPSNLCFVSNMNYDTGPNSVTSLPNLNSTIVPQDNVGVSMQE